MDTMSQSIEAIRARYRPERIGTLLVGESAPAATTQEQSDDQDRRGRHRCRSRQRQISGCSRMLVTSLHRR